MKKHNLKSNKLTHYSHPIRHQVKRLKLQKQKRRKSPSSIKMHSKQFRASQISKLGIIWHLTPNFKIYKSRKNVNFKSLKTKSKVTYQARRHQRKQRMNIRFKSIVSGRSSRIKRISIINKDKRFQYLWITKANRKRNMESWKTKTRRWKTDFGKPCKSWITLEQRMRSLLIRWLRCKRRW